MLKILVVEDDGTKLRNIVKALQSVPGCDLTNIEQTAYANEAKRLLKANEYDLLILDIAIPERPDRSPSAEGGIGLLQEILDRETRYYRPKHIVGLTGYPDILRRFANKFEEDLWMVIQYTPSSDHWAGQLKRKVEYIVLAQRSHPVPEYGIHLGIVAATQTPELAAVLDTVPWQWTSNQIPSDASNYFKGEFARDNEKREVVAVAAPRMGIAAASIVSTKLIMSFRPRYLAMIGIAAGVRGRCQIGDIAVADPSWDWGSGKIATSGRFQQAPHQISLDSFVRSKFALLEQDLEALDSIRRSWNGSKIDHVLRLHIGPVASGSAVLADKKTSSQIVKQHRKLLAIEMETYGLYAAAEESPLPQPKVFSLKSISDFADKKKNDAYQKYAAFTSAQALRAFAEKYL
jgi:nucleoside phosphorylase/CheY-like chemotaxis protein